MNQDAVKDFLAANGVAGDDDWETRMLGSDEAMVDLIIDVIERGEKTSTFSLPWLAEAQGHEAPSPGRWVVILGANGAPRLLLRLTAVTSLTFGEVDEGTLAGEGKPMRDPAAWRPLHEQVWNAQLAPLGREVSDDMPLWAEDFELVARA